MRAGFQSPVTKAGTSNDFVFSAPVRMAADICGQAKHNNEWHDFGVHGSFCDIVTFISVCNSDHTRHIILRQERTMAIARLWFFATQTTDRQVYIMRAHLNAKMIRSAFIKR